MNTAILVVVELHVHYALHSIKKGNRLGMQVGLVTTFLLGAMFLLTQINEYVKAGFSISDGAFASVFYGLTGLHGLHVFVGPHAARDHDRARIPRPLQSARPTWASSVPASTGTSWM